MRQPPHVRRGSEAGHAWEVAERAAHPALAGAVLGYCGFAEDSPVPVRRREAPQARVTLVLNLGAPIRVGDAALRSFVAPLGDRPAVTEFAGASRGVEVRLSPLAARALLGVPLRELDAPAVDLEALLGPAAERLAERLDAAAGWPARFALLDRVLLARLQDAPAPPPDVAWAWRRLRETGGTARIGALAADLGCSGRHLGARFAEHVGPAPKAAARILRFRRALAGLERGEPPAAVAQACGFSDQAHLNRDFRALAGVAPTRYAAARRGLGVAA